MIIRRKPGKTLYWGEALDPDNLAGSADGSLATLELFDSGAAVTVDGGKVRLAEIGSRVQAGPVVLTLTAIERGEAHWDVRAPRSIRILRDDAKRR